MRGLAFFFAMTLAACAPDGGTASSAPQTIDAAWIAERIEGISVSPPGVVTMTIANGRVFGNAGCNSYSGTVAIKGGTIKFGQIASTLMACDDGGRMRQEAAFHAILRDAALISNPNDSKLEISSASGRIISFTRKR